MAILGNNRAGKTDACAITNLLQGERGEVTKGQHRRCVASASNLSPADLVQRGVVQVMEGRHCFAHLTIEENLMTSSYTRTSKAEIAANLEKVYNFFPRLQDRAAPRRPPTPRAASSRCAPSARRSWPTPAWCCWTSPPWAWRPQIVEEVFNIVKDLNTKEGHLPAGRAEHQHGAGIRTTATSWKAAAW